MEPYIPQINWTARIWTKSRIWTSGQSAAKTLLVAFHRPTDKYAQVKLGIMNPQTLGLKNKSNIFEMKPPRLVNLLQLLWVDKWQKKHIWNIFHLETCSYLSFSESFCPGAWPGANQILRRFLCQKTSPVVIGVFPTEMLENLQDSKDSQTQ